MITATAVTVFSIVPWQFWIWFGFQVFMALWLIIK